MPFLPSLRAGASLLDLFNRFPETSRPLIEFHEALLRGPSPFTGAERELIAAYVSRRNECEYCSNSHAATAAAQLPGGASLVGQVFADPDDAGLSEKLRALLDIADLVRVDGRLVSADVVAKARAAGATDREIHDTVLISAAFCMYNRYVDGLGTAVPDDPGQYAAGAQALVEHGYRAPG